MLVFFIFENWFGIGQKTMLIVFYKVLGTWQIVGWDTIQAICSRE